MTTISFDIGIKNLAYCVFHRDTSSILLKDWGVINLSSTSEPSNAQGPLCNCEKAKSGTCGKKAAFFLGTNYYCNVHAKNSGKQFPSKETSMPAIRKLKVDELTQFCTRHFVTVLPKDKRADLLQKVQTQLEKSTLQPVPKPKKTNANQVHSSGLPTAVGPVALPAGTGGGGHAGNCAGQPAPHLCWHSAWPSSHFA